MELEGGGEARSTVKVPLSSSSPGPVCTSSHGPTEIRIQTTSKVVTSSKTMKPGVSIVQELQRGTRWSWGGVLQRKCFCRWKFVRDGASRKVKSFELFKEYSGV